MKNSIINWLLILGVCLSCAQKKLVFERRYEDGEHILYKLKGRNQSPEGMFIYRAKAKSQVKKNKNDFVEEFQFEDVSIDGNPITFNDNHKSIDLKLSLNSKNKVNFPDFSQVHPAIAEAALDLMVIYADLLLVQKHWDMNKNPEQFYLKDSVINSWADNQNLVRAEDSIDFFMNVIKQEPSNNILEIMIKHIPPEKQTLKLNADWMKKPIGTRSNNWLQIKKITSKKLMVSVGRESIEVKIKLDTLYGKIIDASIDRTIVIRERICFDETYMFCGRTNDYELKKEFLLY
jgi:hypothetical protein